MLNKQKGNMYEFVTHTWNVIKGKCEHDCVYCYMKRFPQKDLWFDAKELKTDLGEGNCIFVGSSTDMFAENVPQDWITATIVHCKQYPKNTYLFQTKNPKRFLEFKNLILPNFILGTTIESNREVGLAYSKAPPIIERIVTMEKLDVRKMITIEPVFDFDLDEFISYLQNIQPEWINIGADSNTKRDYIITEPSKEKLKEFIDSCRCFTKVKIKDNLKRLFALDEVNEK